MNAQALSRSLDSLLDDLEVVRWCRRQLALGRGPGRTLRKTTALRCAHAARVLALIRRLDAPFSRELEATVVADAGGVGPSANRPSRE